MAPAACLFSFAQRPDLDHRLHVGDDQLGVLVGHDVGAGDDGRGVGDLDRPVRTPRQVLDHLDPARRLLEVLEHLALRVDRVDGAVEQGVLERTEGQVVLVVAPHPQLGRVVHRDLEHLGLVVPVVRVRELDELDVVHRHVVELEHRLDAHVLLDPPPVVLDGVEALADADLLAPQVGHLEELVAGADRHAAALVHPRGAQQDGAADVGIDVDGRIEAAEADQVVQVVDVVRVPVVLGRVAEVGVVDADLLELLAAPAQLLVHVVRGHHRAVGEPDLVPVERNGGRDTLRHGFGHANPPRAASPPAGGVSLRTLLGRVSTAQATNAIARTGLKRSRTLRRARHGGCPGCARWSPECTPSPDAGDDGTGSPDPQSA